MTARPNFLGIGAAKSGTTTLAALMRLHPEISFPAGGRKELHFFDEKEITPRSISMYFDNFKPNTAVGEFTPAYIFVPKCRDLILKTLGIDTRFIIILRNPVDRAYSHYCHARKHWHQEKYRKLGYPVETLSFEQALEAEADRLKSGEFHIRHQSYFSKGLYADQLEFYYQRFNRENFFICLLEDLVQDPASLLAGIFTFLGVDPEFTIENIDIRLNSQTEGYMDTSTRKLLVERHTT
jgi:hypothetical protein